MSNYTWAGYMANYPRIQSNMALWWYFGLDLDGHVPNHSTISQLRRRKPCFRKVLQHLFEEVVRQCVEKGLVSRRLAVTDSVHVQANDSRTSEHLVEVQEEAGTIGSNWTPTRRRAGGTGTLDGQTVRKTDKTNRKG